MKKVWNYAKANGSLLMKPINYTVLFLNNKCTYFVGDGGIVELAYLLEHVEGMASWILDAGVAASNKTHGCGLEGVACQAIILAWYCAVRVEGKTLCLECVVTASCGWFCSVFVVDGSRLSSGSL